MVVACTATGVITGEIRNSVGNREIIYKIIGKSRNGTCIRKLRIAILCPCGV
jgi:hypothetical protein